MQNNRTQQDTPYIDRAYHDIPVPDLIDLLQQEATTSETITLPADTVIRLLEHVDHLQESAQIDQDAADLLEELTLEDLEHGTLMLMLGRYRLALHAIAGRPCKNEQLFSRSCQTLSPKRQAHWCPICVASHTLSQDELLLGLSRGQEGGDHA